MIRVEFVKPAQGEETAVRLTLVGDDGAEHGSLTVVEPKAEWRFDIAVRAER